MGLRCSFLTDFQEMLVLVVQGRYFEQQGTLPVFLQASSPGQAAPGILLEMQILRLQLRTYIDRVLAVCDLTRPPGDADAHFAFENLWLTPNNSTDVNHLTLYNLE